MSAARRARRCLSQHATTKLGAEALVSAKSLPVCPHMYPVNILRIWLPSQSVEPTCLLPTGHYRAREWQWQAVCLCQSGSQWCLFLDSHSPSLQPATSGENSFWALNVSMQNITATYDKSEIETTLRNGSQTLWCATSFVPIYVRWLHWCLLKIWTSMVTGNRWS